MAQPDNTLGAPTEGLGQNVTFSYNSNVGTPQLEAGDPGRIRAGVVGGPVEDTTRASGVAAPGPNPTLDLLMKVGGSIIGPVIQQKKEEAYIGGMQRAMQGEAVTDIVNSEPWYSKVFGFGADTVEGARAYAGNASANNLVNSMVDKMPDLRTMDGPTAQAFYVKAIQGAKTGDTPTDLAMMQGIQRAMPALMRQQAKEHFAYKQERATAAEDTSFTAGAQSLQKQGEALAKGYVTPEEFAVQQAQFVRSQVPAAGRDMKNWQDAQMDRYIRAARDGNFHAITAGQTPLKPGDPSVFDLLKTDQVSQIQAALERGQKQNRIDNLPQYAEQMSDIELRAEHPPEGTTPQSLFDEASAQNADFTKRTGNTLGPWSPAELIAIKKGAGNAIWHARQAEAVRLEANAKVAATAEAKSRADEDITANIQAQAKIGNLYQYAGTPGGPSNERINYDAQRLYRGLSPAGQADMLIRNSGYLIPEIAKERDENAMATTSAAKVADGSVNAVYADWKILNDQRPDVAAMYYPKAGPKLALMDRMMKAGVPQSDAYENSFVNPIKMAPADAKVRAATIAEIQSKENGLFKEDMDPDAVNLLAKATDDAASLWTSVVGNEKDGTTRAYAVTKAGGKTESIGKYAWMTESPDLKIMPWLIKKNGDGTPAPDGGQVALDTDNVHTIFNRAVKEFIGGARVNQNDGTSFRVPGIASGQTIRHTLIAPIGRAPDGSPALTISVIADDGHQYRGIMSGNDVFKLAARNKASEAAVTGRSQPFATQGATTADRINNRPNLVGANPRANAPQ